MTQSPALGWYRYFRIGLLVLLGLLLLALAQDRLRARPAVLSAYESIASLNAAANDSPTAPATGNGDVQKALGRLPSRMTMHGPFTVEVYSWMAGLPWRSHDYFAVYRPGNNRLVLVTHYAYEMPEYIPPRQWRSFQENGESTGMPGDNGPSSGDPAAMPRPERGGPEVGGPEMEAGRAARDNPRRSRPELESGDNPTADATAADDRGGPTTDRSEDPEATEAP